MIKILDYFSYLIQIILLYLTKGKGLKKEIKERTHLPDCDLIKDVKSCDILLYRFNKDDIVGSLIGFFTSSPYSHCEVYVSNGYDISATPYGVGFVDLTKNMLINDIDLYRFKGELSREKRLIIESKLYKSLLYPYDYFNLSFFKLLKKKSAAIFAGNKAYICSELVSWAYKNADIDLVGDKIESIESPADIAESDQLEYIGTYVNGNKKYTDKRNKFLDENANKSLKDVIINFLGSLTNRYYFIFGIDLNKKSMKV